MLGRRGGGSPAAGSAPLEANPRTARIAAIDLVTALSFGAPQAGRPVCADLSPRPWPASSRACCNRRRGILAARRLGSRQFSGCLGRQVLLLANLRSDVVERHWRQVLFLRTTWFGITPAAGAMPERGLLLPCRHLPTLGPAKRHPSVPMVENGQHAVYPYKHWRFSHSGGSAE